MIGWLPRRYLPVLMYHRIGESQDGDPNLWISPDTFRLQLDLLRREGFTTLSLGQAFECLASRRFAAKTVLLTFDDAFEETLVVAAPMLAEIGMQATTFAPAGLLGQTVELQHPDGRVTASAKGRIADAPHLREWLASGQGIGSHSLSHKRLPDLDAVTIRQEAQESKRCLEDAIGRAVEDFCYPFAHHDASVRREIEAAGYRCAYAGEPPRDDLFAVPRMMVYPHDDLQRFRRKISGYYYWISAWHKRFVGD